MHSRQPESAPVAESWAMDRRDFLKMSGAGLAGAALLGTLGSGASAKSASPKLTAEFEDAADEYGVPAIILMAMGYINTRWAMPAPDTNEYRRGELHGWGSYGIMALVKNPFSDTLGEASRLTGISEERLKSDRRSNIRGGAALLAEALGTDQPTMLEGFRGAMSGRGKAGGKNYDAVAGVGSGELYADQVFEAVVNGASEMIRGEEISLSASKLTSTVRGA